MDERVDGVNGSQRAVHMQCLSLSWYHSFPLKKKKDNVCLWKIAILFPAHLHCENVPLCLFQCYVCFNEICVGDFKKQVQC